MLNQLWKRRVSDEFGIRSPRALGRAAGLREQLPGRFSFLLGWQRYAFNILVSINPRRLGLCYNTNRTDNLWTARGDLPE